MTETLYEKTKRLLEARPPEVSLTKLAREIGQSPAWLTKLARGGIPNPGVETIQKLHDKLVTMRGGDHV